VPLGGSSAAIFLCRRPARPRLRRPARCAAFPLAPSVPSGAGGSKGHLAAAASNWDSNAVLCRTWQNPGANTRAAFASAPIFTPDGRSRRSFRIGRCGPVFCHALRAEWITARAPAQWASDVGEPWSSQRHSSRDRDGRTCHGCAKSRPPERLVDFAAHLPTRDADVLQRPAAHRRKLPPLARAAPPKADQGDPAG